MTVYYLLVALPVAHLIWRAVRRRRAPHYTRREYRACYLRSPHWLALRARWWRAHPDATCLHCGCGHPLDLHHITYARVGHERLDDLVPLCRIGHDLAHRYGRIVHADAA